MPFFLNSFKKICFSVVGIFCFFGYVSVPAIADENSAEEAGETVENSLKNNGEQFLFPLHGTPSPKTQTQPADSGVVGDGTNQNAGTIVQGEDQATISNNAGDTETVTQNPNTTSGSVVRGKNGKVIGYVDSQSSPGTNRISDANGNILGSIIRSRRQGGYQVVDQYGKSLGFIDTYGQVYNYYGQGIGTIPPGGSPADLYAAWTLIKQH